MTSANAETVDRAVRAAQGAFGAWSRRAITDRGAVLHAGAEALLEHVD